MLRKRPIADPFVVSNGASKGEVVKIGSGLLLNTFCALSATSVPAPIRNRPVRSSVVDPSSLTAAGRRLSVTLALGLRKAASEKALSLSVSPPRARRRGGRKIGPGSEKHTSEL